MLRSSQNNGTNSGQFHYNGQPLDDEQIQGLPGCSLVPVVGVRQFRVNVDFDPTAGNARYDLFEIDQNNGAQVDLQERRLASDPDGIIGFGIDGTVAAAEADVPARLEPRPSVRKKKTAKKKTKKTAKPKARGASKAKKAKKASRAKKARKGTRKAGKRVTKGKKR